LDVNLVDLVFEVLAGYFQDFRYGAVTQVEAAFNETHFSLDSGLILKSFALTFLENAMILPRK
jgi:hypothetical protein